MQERELVNLLKSPCAKCLLRFGLIILALILVLCIGTWSFRAQVLPQVYTFLTADDALQSADLIFVLLGESDARPLLAVDLFQRGLAPQIAIAQARQPSSALLGERASITDMYVNLLRREGITATEIAVIPFEGGVNSTRDEAKALRDYVKTHALQRVIVITSAYHSRRAKWTLEKTFAGSSISILMAAARESDYDESNWWKTEQGMMFVVDEYIKFGYYLLTYR